MKYENDDGFKTLMYEGTSDEIKDICNKPYSNPADKAIDKIMWQDRRSSRMKKTKLAKWISKR